MASAEDTAGSTRREWSSSTRLALIALIYSIAHGISLFNRGLYWDDWVFWKLDWQVLRSAVAEMGSTWPAEINRLFFYSQAGITFNRFVTFAAMLVAALLLYDVLRRLPGISRDVAMWIAVAFGVFPAFESRIALVMVGYPLCVALFMGAIWLLVRYAPRPPVLVRVLMALLFFASFRTGSLLVFFAVVPLLVLIVDPPESYRVWPVVRRLLAYADQMILPVAYWVMTRLWFQPSGRYAGYNTPGASIAGFVDVLHVGLQRVMSGPVIRVEGSLPFKVPLAVAAVVCVVLVFVLRRRPLERYRGWVWLTLTGVLLLVLAVAPYAAVGKAPGNNGWETRHQLLVPFGGAFVAIGLILACVRSSRASRILGQTILIIAVAAAVLAHVDSYITYERDWLKQEALIEAFRDDPTVRDSHFILIEDETMDLDVTERMSYEWTGMLAEAFGNESRFAVRRVYWGGDFASVTRHVAYEPYYKAGEFAGGPPDCIVTISRGDVDLRRTWQVLWLMALDWTDREALSAKLEDAITIEARVYTAADRRIDTYPPLIR